MVHRPLVFGASSVEQVLRRALETEAKPTPVEGRGTRRAQGDGAAGHGQEPRPVREALERLEARAVVPTLPAVAQLPSCATDDASAASGELVAVSGER